MWCIVWWAITDIRAISCSRVFTLAFSSCRPRIIVLLSFRPRVFVTSTSHLRTLVFSHFRPFVISHSGYGCFEAKCRYMTIMRVRHDENARVITLSYSPIFFISKIREYDNLRAKWRQSERENAITRGWNDDKTIMSVRNDENARAKTQDKMARMSVIAHHSIDKVYST